MDIKPGKRRPPKQAASNNQVSTAPKKPVHSARKISKKTKKRLFVRYAIISVNIAIVIIASVFVINYSDSNAASFGSVSSQGVKTTSPLDEISAADIAVNVARMTNMPETNAVTNYADTVNSELETFTVASEVTNKPQIISDSIKTLDDIIEYITKPGDTVPGLAEKFAVTSDSIKWSNDLTDDQLQADIRILIPPMNGVIYTVRSGDTAEKIAQLYDVSYERLVLFNDLDVKGLVPGGKIFLPNAQKPAPMIRSSYVRYGNNGYDPGWCTYYAAAKGGAPAGWGHARTWAVNAARTGGWVVSKVPVPGAIAQTTGISGDRVGGSWGHVAVVEAVKQENGQYYIKYSDMNGIAGFNRVGYSEWVPALDKYQNFIYQVR